MIYWILKECEKMLIYIVEDEERIRELERYTAYGQKYRLAAD